MEIFIKKIITDESTWLIDNETIEITMAKGITSSTWWKCAIQGDPEIDVQKIEGSQYVDQSLIDRLKREEEDKEEQDEKERLKKEKEDGEKSTEISSTIEPTLTNN